MGDNAFDANKETTYLRLLMDKQDANDPIDSIHGEICTLSTAEIKSIAKLMTTGDNTLEFFENGHGQSGLVELHFHDAPSNFDREIPLKSCEKS